MKSLVAFLIVFLAAAPATAQSWIAGPADGQVTFKVKNLAGWVVGGFDDYAAEVVYDPAAPEATTIEAVVITSSLNTKNPQRDKHLRSEDFFDSANHPKMTFKSTSAAVVDGGLAITGDLSIRGHTKQIVLALVGPGDEAVGADGKTRRGATATATVQRVDFGMDWKLKGALVGPEVFISIDMAVRKRD